MGAIAKKICPCCDLEFKPKKPGQKFISRKHAVRYAVSLHWHRTHRDYHGTRQIKRIRVIKCGRCKKPFEVTPGRANPNPGRIRFCPRCREQNSLDVGKGKMAESVLRPSIRAVILARVKSKYMPTSEIVKLVRVVRPDANRENIHVVISRMFMTYRELDRCGRPPLCMYKLRDKFRKLHHDSGGRLALRASSA